MKFRFGAGHALKSPAHITLQMPFRREDSKVRDMIKSLKEFASHESGFQVALCNFDCFAPRVLFVKIVDHKPIAALHDRLKSLLREELDVQSKDTFDFNPHMTIATRDLTEDAFEKAWPEFRNRKFEASFMADSLVLLKHNGKNWEVFKVFPFNA